MRMLGGLWEGGRLGKLDDSKRIVIRHNNHTSQAVEGHEYSPVRITSFPTFSRGTSAESAPPNTFRS